MRKRNQRFRDTNTFIEKEENQSQSKEIIILFTHQRFQMKSIVIKHLRSTIRDFN